MSTQPQSLSTAPPQALALKHRYAIKWSCELIAVAEERHTLAAFLGVRDDERLYEKAFEEATCLLGKLRAIDGELTGNGGAGPCGHTVAGGAK